MYMDNTKWSEMTDKERFDKVPIIYVHNKENNQNKWKDIYYEEMKRDDIGKSTDYFHKIYIITHENEAFTDILVTFYHICADGKSG